jgi:hypothetical protein
VFVNTLDIVKFCWLAPAVFSPSVLEGVFHVKSRVSVAFTFIIVRYLLVAFITTTVAGFFSFSFRLCAY